MKNILRSRREASAILVMLLLTLGTPTSAETGLRLESHSVPSVLLGEEVAISVYLPSSYESGQERYPCLYLLEDGMYHRALTGTTDVWARLDGMPELIVVGVSTTDRWRDFTPTRAGFPGGEPIPSSGGGERHLSFLAEELIPHVEARYRTRPLRILYGHSIAGLQVVNAFLYRPDLFGAHIATSPSLWWDDEVATARLGDVLDHDPDRAGCLFLAMGNEDETMQAPLRRFCAALAEKGGPRLRWTSSSYPSASHPQVPLQSFGDALDFVFEGWTLPAASLEAGVEAVDAHYAELTRRFGYPVSVPESVINRLGYQALGNDRVEEAIELFLRNVEAHPESANVYDSLGEAYLRRGDRDRARVSYEKALELDPDSRSARSALEDLRQGRLPPK